MAFGNVVPGLFGGSAALPCVTGFVNLFRFIVAPAPGSIIGEVKPLGGAPIPIVQTTQTPLGGISLASVDRQLATLCGVLTIAGGQLALNVLLVNPGAASPTGTPLSLNALLLALLLGLPAGSIAGLGGLGGAGGLGAGFGGGRF
ncbi:MAG: hypothetical protein ACM3ZA_15730 [Bacillota bacterium]